MGQYSKGNTTKLIFFFCQPIPYQKETSPGQIAPKGLAYPETFPNYCEELP